MSSNLIRAFAYIGVAICFLTPILVWLPACPGGDCVAAQSTEQPLPFAMPHDIDEAGYYTYINATGAGIEIRLKNGTSVIKHWSHQFRREDIASGPFFISRKPYVGIGLGLKFKNGSKIHKFWYVNGTSYEKTYAPPH